MLIERINDSIEDLFVILKDNSIMIFENSNKKIKVIK
jgi:hypothetical protein